MRSIATREERIEAFRTVLFDLSKSLEEARLAAEGLGRALYELDRAAKEHAEATRKAKKARAHYEAQKTDAVNTLKRAEDEAVE